MSPETEANLPAGARRAWRAYLAMCESKQAYFSLLSAMEEQYKTTGQPTREEKERLAELLQQHDARVRAFNEAMTAADNASRHALLLKLQTAKK
jgi:hypothetical protein